MVMFAVLGPVLFSCLLESTRGYFATNVEVMGTCSRQDTLWYSFLPYLFSWGQLLKKEQILLFKNRPHLEGLRNLKESYKSCSPLS